MRFGSILAVAVATLASVVSGIITGIAVPKTIKAGGDFELIITTADWIISIYDVSVAVGIAPGKGYQGSLGQVVGSNYLGPSRWHPLHINTCCTFSLFLDNPYCFALLCFDPSH